MRLPREVIAGDGALNIRPGTPARSKKNHMKTETEIQISKLHASLSGEVIGPDDSRYDEMRRVFFTGFDRRPAAIVRAAMHRTSAAS
jgi:hypothetical protein